ncbi:NosD domain-containing protein [Promethearchaeum syntrophicum]|uniref:NosD domain-containing protein n=1 Tax=Promethearchaeum syntrophicum TaxID=2594042 RepID=A0A5B9DAS2_9ARCH|nr:NosD domain-containing protein [Candidatus Prometheoarchaeum syntrophicum]QEE15706.1 hypothetical protein DSAG12_01533 [Candidatus Prometheoarchaeum syntrophicum]
MRNGNKNRTLSQITLIILGICIILISSIETHASYNNPAQNQEKNIEIKAATFLISHDPIRIDGNNALESFCAGNGTDGLSWETAFKIENYSIISGEESGISINNTDRFLIINNCSIENFWDTNYGATDNGIKILNCSNIKITDCSLTNNTLGIFLDSSTDITLIQNNCSHNDWGFTLLRSENNTLFNNTALYNEHDGIRICEGDYNNITSNVANFNYQNGINIASHFPHIGYAHSYGNSIVNNLLMQNQDDGIQIEYSDSNSVLNNFVFNNGNSGISLQDSSQNILSLNVIDRNNNEGIEIEDGSNWNLITKNKISNNSYGIMISLSSYNTIGENLIVNHSHNGILIFHMFEDHLEQNIYGNTFENNSGNIAYIQVSSGRYEPPYEYIGLAVLIIGIVIFPLIYRKKIKKNLIESDSKLIYKILKIALWISIVFTMAILIFVSYGAPIFLVDIPILIIVLLVLNRKKITKRRKKFIAEREIKKSEQKIAKANKSKEAIEEKNEKPIKSKKKSLKSSKILIKNMNRKDSKLINKILRVFLWFVMVCLFILLSIFTLGIFDIIVIIILIIYNKKTKYYFNNLRSNKFIKRGQKRTIKAINYAKMHYYKKSRYYWLRSERNYHRALRIIPDFHKIDFLEKKIISIKQNTLATYLSEGIVLSKIAWFQFQENNFSQAKKQYSKSITLIEGVLKNIDTDYVFNQKVEFPITASLIFEILQFLRKNTEQIKNKANYKNKSKVFIKSSDIQEINEKIVKSLKETNESLWIYCQSLDSYEDLINLEGLSNLLENKLTKSEKMLLSAQDQMQYLLAYMQRSTNRFERKGIETKSIAMNKNRTSEQERFENKHLNIIREYEYIGGKIRLKVGIVNHSDNVLTNLALRFDLPDALKWIIHEPNLKRRGDTIHIARLGGNEKIAISLYLEPINCLESMINATLTYFDSKDQPQAVIMTPKKVSISCPIFFTREEANIARVKKIQLQLKYEDHKIFPLVKSNKSELIFNKILGSIGKHDVKLVQKEFSLDNNKGEAYFYGVTKVKKDKMIIHLILDSNHQIIEISVNGDEQEPITGLLAELESEIRDKLLVHNIIEDSDKFHDINTSILLGNCPFCNGPISQSNIAFFKKGETISCKYCDTTLSPY